MDYPKIVGWIIFLAGIAIVGWTLMSSYNIFTGEVAAPEIFKVAEKEVLPKEEGILDIQAQLQTMIGEQLKGILPSDSITKLLNLVVWSMLAGLLIFGGSQISSLGIKLIKK